MASRSSPGSSGSGPSSPTASISSSRSSRFDRELRDERKAVPILWAEGEFDVRVRVRLNGPGDLPYVVLADWVPTDANFVDGADEVVVALSADRPAEFAYRLTVPGARRVCGSKASASASPTARGSSTTAHSSATGPTYPVLPRLTGAERPSAAASKRHNIFPPPGVHRLKRPGGGSELLDLRDYIPGDPPKMIAWKPSARKDKLFTKEFESEVPVRCTLFVDASESTRLGAKRTKITRLANLAAGVAEAAVADRDHAGLVVFDEHDVPGHAAQAIAPARHRHAQSAGEGGQPGRRRSARSRTPMPWPGWPIPLANELYPDLMHKRVEHGAGPNVLVTGQRLPPRLVGVACSVCRCCSCACGPLAGFACPVRRLGRTCFGSSRRCSRRSFRNLGVWPTRSSWPGAVSP